MRHTLPAYFTPKICGVAAAGLSPSVGTGSLIPLAAEAVRQMAEITDAEVGEVDLAVVAYLDEGDWYVQELPGGALDSVETIAKELRRYPGESGALALISVDEEFVLLIRAQGHLVKVLLSDASAATEWTLARSAIDHIGLPVEDDDEQVPAGDLGIISDLGVPAPDMGELLDDYDLYPDEILSEIAGKAGFGSKFDDLAGLSNA